MWRISAFGVKMLNVKQSIPCWALGGHTYLAGAAFPDVSPKVGAAFWFKR